MDISNDTGAEGTAVGLNPAKGEKSHDGNQCDGTGGERAIGLVMEDKHWHWRTGETGEKDAVCLCSEVRKSAC